MKKHVIIMTGAALLSTSAFATKARMTALGQDEARGSQYLNDTRNVFRNAAHVNNTNNYVVTEWGAAADAEGGMFRDAGSFAYGLYFNNQNNNEARAAAGSTPSIFDDQTNRLDLFFGGDAGIQWGARVGYAKSEDENDETDNSVLDLGVGILMGDISAYANILLSDDSEGSDNDSADKWEGSGINVGVAYKWNNWTFHADYDNTGEDVTTDADKTEYTETTLAFGAAQTHEISSTAMVFTAVDYMNVKEEDKEAGTTTETKSSALKATIGFEADATSWLTWRGSISQNVFIGSSEVTGAKKETTRDTTVVGAGASLTFGKLMVDGTLEGSTTGDFNFSDLLANVAVSYWF